MPAARAASATIAFCGIDFWNQSLPQLFSQMRESGGYLVVPSAPSFTYMLHDPEFERAMLSADFAVVDSGYLALFMAVLLRRKVRRISGLKLLQYLFEGDAESWSRESRILWVSPSVYESKRIAHYLRTQDFDAGKQTYYEAPMYAEAKDFRDSRLKDLMVTTSPDLIVLAIAGGKQEKLAFELTRGQADCPPIICTGAAIAFLSGGQARIPTWADRCCLGWLIRIYGRPGVFFPRYARASWELPWAIAKYNSSPSLSFGADVRK